MPLARAMKAETTHLHDYITPYVADLRNVIDIAAIVASGLKIGVDPMGGASVGFWEPIAEMYGLNLEVVNPRVDPTFSFMTVDKDGKIRMDCSSPYAMASLIGLKDRFDIAFGNDPDADRHGIVTPSVGLMNPNHYLAVAIWYLFQNRPGWRPDAAVGKTLVSSSMIDRVAAHLGRRLCEVPVGFKWFVDGLLDGSFGFGGEESAGASFLRQDGTVWTTDKDGIILDLLAAEITAVTGRDPGEHYRKLTEQFGDPVYERADVVATPAQKAALERLSPEMVTAQEPGRREDRRQAHPRAVQRCADRRAEGGHRKRLVCGPAIGHRGHLQDLRRELPWQRPSPDDLRRSAGDRSCRIQRGGGVSRRSSTDLMSVARIAIIPLQDVLGIGSEGRMNTPGRASGNWGWRFAQAMLTPELTGRLAELTETSGRAPRDHSHQRSLSETAS